MSDEIYIAVYWSRVIVYIVKGSACEVRLFMYPVIPVYVVYDMNIVRKINEKLCYESYCAKP